MSLNRTIVVRTKGGSMLRQNIITDKRKSKTDHEFLTTKQEFAQIVRNKTLSSGKQHGHVKEELLRGIEVVESFIAAGLVRDRKGRLFRYEPEDARDAVASGRYEWFTWNC